MKVRRQHVRVTRARRVKRAPSRAHQARSATRSRVGWKSLLGLSPRQLAGARKSPGPVRAAEQIVSRMFVAVRKAARWN